MDQRVTLSIVVPCFNEEAVLPETARRLSALLNELASLDLITIGDIYFVDDGSSDNSWGMVEEFASANPHIHGIKLSRNCGHQRALLAGLLSVPGDVLISLDADLQDDLEAIKEMLVAHANGAEIVYGVRRHRAVDAWFKRVTAEVYYRTLQYIGVQLIFNHADFRLLGRNAIEALRAYKETNLFLRGVIPQLGFSSALVYYDRRERFAGTSKYPVSKMMALAFEGVTSFSDVPLKLITMLGLLISAAGFVLAIWALWVRITNPAAVPGWASTVIPLYILGGVQLLCTGVVGQYMAKIYLETKSRPRFIIEKQV